MLIVIPCFLMLVSKSYVVDYQDGQALADGLKCNSSLVELCLPSNNIGDGGAEAPVLRAAGWCGGSQ